MKRGILAFLAIVFLAPFAMTGADYPQKPASGYYVADQAEVIGAAYEEQINSLCRELELSASINVGVSVISTTGDEDIALYTEGLAKNWHEDQANSIVMVVAVDDHEVYTAVGDKLKEVLPDATVERLQKKILIPNFRQHEYGRGIYWALRLYARDIAEAYDLDLESIDSPAGTDVEENDLGNAFEDAARIATCCACLHGIHVVHHEFWDVAPRHHRPPRHPGPPRHRRW